MTQISDAKSNLYMVLFVKDKRRLDFSFVILYFSLIVRELKPRLIVSYAPFPTGRSPPVGSSLSRWGYKPKHLTLRHSGTTTSSDVVLSLNHWIGLCDTSRSTQTVPYHCLMVLQLNDVVQVG